MNSDSISDCFTRLRNAAKAGRETVNVPYSKMKEEVLDVLRLEGFLVDVNIVDEGGKKNIVARIKYHKDGRPLLEHIRRVSKPGHRVYRESPRGGTSVRGGLGFQILSTSSGIMTDKIASEKHVGGEVIGEVW